MNILITDIKGFVGANLVQVLKEDHTIYGLDFVTSEIDGVKNVYPYSELSSIPEVDLVIHLAGKALDTINLSEYLEYYEINAGLTRRLFGWFTQSTAKTFIYFSSVKAAANQDKGAPVTENMEPKPFGVLGESKLMAESYILSQWTHGKKVYVLRPSIINGEGGLGSKNLKILYKWAKYGWPFPFGEFPCIRSYLSIDNLCFVLKRMIDLDIPGGIYNVTDDESLQLDEVYEIICSIKHKKRKLWHVNKKMVHLIARVCTLFHGTFNDYQYQKLSSNFVVSNEKIKKELGIKRMPVSVVDGLTKTINSLQD